MALFTNIKKHGGGKFKRKGEFLHGLTSITASLSIEDRTPKEFYYEFTDQGVLRGLTNITASLSIENTEEYDYAFTEQGVLHGLTSIAAGLIITEATQKDFNIKDNEALKIFMSAIISIQEV